MAESANFLGSSRTVAANWTWDGSNLMYPIHQLSDSLINLPPFFFEIVATVIILLYKFEEGERRVESEKKRPSTGR